METIINHISNTITYIIDTLDLVYLIFFMLTSYVAIKGIKLNIKTRWQVLTIGIFFAIIFGLCKLYFGLPYHSTEKHMPYAYVLFFTFITGQFINLYGIDRLVDYIIKKVKYLLEILISKFN